MKVCFSETSRNAISREIDYEHKQLRQQSCLLRFPLEFWRPERYPMTLIVSKCKWTKAQREQCAMTKTFPRLQGEHLNFASINISPAGITSTPSSFSLWTRDAREHWEFFPRETSLRKHKLNSKVCCPLQRLELIGSLHREQKRWHPMRLFNLCCRHLSTGNLAQNWSHCQWN